MKKKKIVAVEYFYNRAASLQRNSGARSCSRSRTARRERSYRLDDRAGCPSSAAAAREKKKYLACLAPSFASLASCLTPLAPPFTLIAVPALGSSCSAARETRMMILKILMKGGERREGGGWRGEVRGNDQPYHKNGEGISPYPFLCNGMYGSL